MAAKAQVQIQAEPASGPEREPDAAIPVSLSSTGAEFGVVPPSPANVLREILREELLADVGPRYSRRRVTATVIVVCAAFWISLYMLVTQLF